MEHLLAMESRRLSFLMAELPQELGIEEVAVKLAEEALHSSQDEANLMDMTEAGEATTGEAQVRLGSSYVGCECAVVSVLGSSPGVAVGSKRWLAPATSEAWDLATDSAVTCAALSWALL